MRHGKPSGADFSPCRKWRYVLWRQWGAGDRFVSFIGLNPSTADETKNDPTVTRCINYAKRWGFDGMYMLNIFAYRATDPRDMKAVPDPVGPGNDAALLEYWARSEITVAAWGVHGAYRDRAASVRRRIAGLHCLGITKDGNPKHPLYLKSELRPVVLP